MVSRSSACLAAMTVFAAALAAAPARAGGPLQAPDGQFAGFQTHYRIPPTFLDSVSDQCLRVTCWRVSPEGSDEIAAGIELWGSGTDASRPPIHQGPIYLYSVTSISSATVCVIGQPVVGRIVAAPIKKLRIECTAELIDSQTSRTLSILPLLSPLKH